MRGFLGTLVDKSTRCGWWPFSNGVEECAGVVWSCERPCSPCSIFYFVWGQHSHQVVLCFYFHSSLYLSLACQWDCLQKMEHHPCVKMRWDFSKKLRYLIRLIIPCLVSTVGWTTITIRNRTRGWQGVVKVFEGPLEMLSWASNL